MNNSEYYFSYAGIQFRLNYKTYCLLRDTIYRHISILKFENTKYLVNSIDFPIQDLKLIIWRMSISTMDGSTTITLFKNNKIFDCTTYSEYSLDNILNNLIF